MLTKAQAAWLKIEYEGTRLERYGHIRQNAFYAPNELAVAYEAWAYSYSGNRDLEWDDYCDVRDRVPHGTNSHIRREKAKSRFH